MFQYTRDNEKNFVKPEDYLKYYSFRSRMERYLVAGSDETDKLDYQIYDQDRVIQSKYNYFVPYENDCRDVRTYHYEGTTEHIITQKSLIPIGPQRFVFKLTKKKQDCKKRTVNPIDCYY